MIEYIADALPGEPLLPEAPYDIYRAHASGQFLGAHLGSLVPILGCVKYLVPRLAGHGSRQAGCEARVHRRRRSAD